MISMFDNFSKECYRGVAEFETFFSKSQTCVRNFEEVPQENAYI